MIISASTDYRAAAQRKLPPFLFHYADGGAYAEHTLRHNVSDLASIALRQRVLKNMSELSLQTELFGETLSMPVALAPVGLTGMYARRGEVQAARAAAAHGIPFTMSTVSVCPIEEVAPAIDRPMWFQLYVLKDRGFMRNALERAKAARRPHTMAGTLAKRFAAKEAFSKAVGTGFKRGVYLKDIGVVNAPSGLPTLHLTGGAKARLDAMAPTGHAVDVHLTMTDDHPWAQAFVILYARKMEP